LVIKVLETILDCPLKTELLIVYVVAVGTGNTNEFVLHDPILHAVLDVILDTFICDKGEAVLTLMTVGLSIGRGTQTIV
jgi:hypothetical protein